MIESVLAISYYDVTFAAGLLAMANSTQSLKPDPLVLLRLEAGKSLK